MDSRNPHGFDPQHSFNARNRKSRRASWKRYVLYFMLTMMLLAVGSIVAAGLYIQSLLPKTPSIEDLLNARIAEPSLLFSADGTQLAVFSRGQQERVDLLMVSPNVTNALIATEDHRFYEHPGIDIRRTLAAVFHTANGDAQGGSTITQQLVRNMFPEEIGRSRTIERKLKEIITAIKIERAYTKNQILETYLNTVPFLYNVVGIEMAARTYYDKSAAELNVLESATLIGMLKGTSYYNPILNPERARKRRNVVLGQMVKRQMLSEDEFRTLREQPLQVSLNRQPDPLGTAPHFAAYLRKRLVEWADQNDYNIYTDGLIIHSTIDDRMQEAAARAVEREAEVLQNVADVEWGQRTDRVASHTAKTYASLRKKVEPFRHFWSERPDLLDAFVRESPEYKKAIASGKVPAEALAMLKSDSGFMTRLRAGKTRLEAGFVAMDPVSGEIKAWVGSRDFERDQFDHVAQAERQPGSTFKPIVYGAALELGMRPDQAYQDGPVEIRAPDGSIWRPTDMSGISGRMMSLREGLIYSKNTITVQVMRDVGLPHIVDLARAMGIKQSRLNAVPSLSLGTSPVTLLEMVSAYSTIARVGEYREPIMIKRITDRSGKVLAEFNTESSRAMSENTAIELIDMMRGVVTRGTGQTVKTEFGITADIAGKTGTTQNNTDGWFILMHPNMVAGAWVGFNDSRVSMRSDYWGQGGHNAALVVGDFFKDTLSSKLLNVKAQFPKPNRPPPLIVKSPDEGMDQLNPDVNQLPSGYGIVRGENGESIIIGPDAAQAANGRQSPGSPASADGLGHVVTNMAQDPGGRTSIGSSSGDSGAPEDEAEPPRGRMPSPADINLF